MAIESLITLVMTAVFIPVVAFFLKKSFDDAEKQSNALSNRITSVTRRMEEIQLNVSKSFEIIKLDLEGKTSSLDRVLIKLEMETTRLLKTSENREDFLVNLSRMSTELRIDLERLKEKSTMIKKYSHEDFGYQRGLLRGLENINNKQLVLFKTVDRMLKILVAKGIIVRKNK